MRKQVFLLGVVLTLALAPDARAQLWQPLDGRAFVNLNAGFQPGPGDLNQSVTFPLYDEQGLFESAQKGESGIVFDISGGYRVWRKASLGVALTRFKNTGSAVISGELPNPLFFDRDRNFETEATGLKHEQLAIHVQAIWTQPILTNLDVAVSLGPSFFSFRQDVAAGIEFGDGPPPFNSVTIDKINVARVEEGVAGFNIGAEGVYMITKSLGADLLLRYTRGAADVTLPTGGQVEVHLGGLQVGGGLRVRF